MIAEYNELESALQELSDALRDNAQRNSEVLGRIEAVLAQLAAGSTVAEITHREHRPQIVELISQNLEVLQTLGANTRFAHARALRADGLTIEEIAQLFSVTRQRISALLSRGH